MGANCENRMREDKGRKEAILWANCQLLVISEEGQSLDLIPSLIKQRTLKGPRAAAVLGCEMCIAISLLIMQ